MTSEKHIFYFTYGCGQLVNAFFCRRYKPEFTLGDLGLMMAPYAGIFLVVATAVMLLWFKLGLPFGC